MEATRYKPKVTEAARAARQEVSGHIRALRASLWMHGQLDYLLRPGGQRRLYEFIRAWKDRNPTAYGPVVALCHRHLGKSTCTGILLTERLVQKPSNVLFLAPKHNQCERILRPILRYVLKDLPSDIVMHRRLNCMTFKNPRWDDKHALSTFQWLGTDKDRGNPIRGCGAQNMIVIDEPRDCLNIQDVIESVLSFSFQKQEDPILLLITTPPASLDHPLTRPKGYIDQAMAIGSFIKIGASQNPAFSKADEKAILDCCAGDKNSDFWKREAECELIQDPNRATVREYGSMQKIVEVDSYERPDRFFPMIVADMGWEDRSAVLACYVDYHKSMLIVEDEILLHRATTRQFAEQSILLETRVFGDQPARRVRRIADATPQQLDDLMREHHLHFQPAERHKDGSMNQPGALARLRTLVAEGRLRILPKARNLRYQMLTGLVKPDGKLERTESLGHQDATAALIYANRMAPWNEDPFDPNEASPDMFRQPDYKPERVEPPTAAAAGRLVFEGGGKLIDERKKGLNAWWRR